MDVVSNDRLFNKIYSVQREGEAGGSQPQPCGDTAEKGKYWRLD